MSLIRQSSLAEAKGGVLQRSHKECQYFTIVLKITSRKSLDVSLNPLTIFLDVVIYIYNTKKEEII